MNTLFKKRFISERERERMHACGGGQRERELQVDSLPSGEPDMGLDPTMRS